MRTRVRACMQPPRCTSTRARAGTPTHAPKGARARTRAGTPMRAHVCARSRARRRAPTRVRALTLVQAGGGGPGGWQWGGRSLPLPVGMPTAPHCPPHSMPCPVHVCPVPPYPGVGGHPHWWGARRGRGATERVGTGPWWGVPAPGNRDQPGHLPGEMGMGRTDRATPPPQSPSRCRVGEQAGGTVRVSSYSRRCRRGCGAGAPDSGSGRRSSGWTGRHPAPPCS